MIVSANILYCHCGQCHNYVLYWHSGTFELVGYHATSQLRSKVVHLSMRFISRVCVSDCLTFLVNLSLYLQPSVKTVTFVCLVLVVTDMEGLKCVSMVLGAPFVMISGATLMPVWCVDSWDSPHMVGCFKYMYCFGWNWPKLQAISR